nr:MAG TPA: hypothetical protein [Bacteriophage sp.]
MIPNFNNRCCISAISSLDTEQYPICCLLFLV